MDRLARTEGGAISEKKTTTIQAGAEEYCHKWALMKNYIVSNQRFIIPVLRKNWMESSRDFSKDVWEGKSAIETLEACQEEPRHGDKEMEQNTTPWEEWNNDWTSKS